MSNFLFESYNGNSQKPIHIQRHLAWILFFIRFRQKLPFFSNLRISVSGIVSNVQWNESVCILMFWNKVSTQRRRRRKIEKKLKQCVNGYDFSRDKTTAMHTMRMEWMHAKMKLLKRVVHKIRIFNVPATTSGQPSGHQPQQQKRAVNPRITSHNLNKYLKSILA